MIWDKIINSGSGAHWPRVAYRSLCNINYSWYYIHHYPRHGDHHYKISFVLYWKNMEGYKYELWRLFLRISKPSTINCSTILATVELVSEYLNLSKWVILLNPGKTILWKSDRGIKSYCLLTMFRDDQGLSFKLFLLFLYPNS